MSVITKRKSLRDLIGTLLKTHKMIMVAVLILVASTTVIELPPPIRVPSTLLLIWLISWFIRDKWSNLGIRRPEHIGRAIAIGISIGIITQVIAMTVLIPLFRQFGVKPIDYTNFEYIQGNLGALLLYLTISWTTAGFGEEIIHRGFLMGHIKRLLGENKVSWVISLLIVSVIFAVGHAYQGLMGMLLVFYSALVLGLTYILSDRNLWYSIIAHGTADTFVFILFFTGFAEKFLQSTPVLE